MASSQNFSVYAGDSEPLRMTMLDSDAVTALDLSAVTQIRFLAKRSQTDPDLAAYITKTLYVQTLPITGAPTGGSFTATVGGQVATIPYNASAANVKALLEALSSVGTGNSIVAGGPLPATPITVILLGAADGQSIFTSGSFTGGSSPAVTPTATGGGVTITSPTRGDITVQLVPADTAGAVAQVQLSHAAKAYWSAIKEETGCTGVLTVVATVIHTT